MDRAMPIWSRPTGDALEPLGAETVARAAFHDTAARVYRLN